MRKILPSFSHRNFGQEREIRKQKKTWNLLLLSWLGPWHKQQNITTQRVKGHIYRYFLRQEDKQRQTCAVYFLLFKFSSWLSKLRWKILTKSAPCLPLKRQKVHILRSLTMLNGSIIFFDIPAVERVSFVNGNFMQILQNTLKMSKKLHVPIPDNYAHPILHTYL